MRHMTVRRKVVELSQIFILKSESCCYGKSQISDKDPKDSE